MDAQQFLAEFGHIANAPGGIDKLRELVLHLAVTGLLVEQHIKDSDVERSLVELSHRRQKIIAERNLSATRKHKNLEKPEAWFSVPQSWCWEFLGYISLWPLKDGDWIESKDQDSNGDVRIIQLADVGVGSYRDRSNRFLTSSKAADLGCYFLERNDVLIARLPDPLGRACIFPGDTKPSVTVVDVAVCRCDPEIIEPRFLMNCLNSPVVSRLIKSWAVGTTRQRVATGRLGAIPLPIAPIEEQSRIVAKVDELMALCDKLEAQQQDRRKLQNALRLSTLQAVANSQSPQELQTTWTRLAENFGQLFHAPEDVSEIKALILDLAIQGLLADRRLDDEPAEMLISRSLESKRLRLFSGEMKNKKPSATDIVHAEINIPAHWKRASLDELFQFIDYRGKTPAKTKSGVVLVTAKNVRSGFISYEPVEFLSESSYQAWMTRGFPRIGDLLITTEAPLGNVARIEEQPSFALAQRVIDLQPFADLNTKCAMYFMMSPLFQSLLEENSTGMTAKGIKAGKLKQLLLAIPPKEEQQRIVQRIEELIRVCSVLSSQLELARKQSARLAVASVSNLIGIAIEQEEEPMKAPQTELIAPLRLGNAPDIKLQAPLATILARHNGEMSAKDLWQRFGGEIDVFYAQLKTEVTHGWILEPAPAEMREKIAETMSA